MTEDPMDEVAEAMRTTVGSQELALRMKLGNDGFEAWKKTTAGGRERPAAQHDAFCESHEGTGRVRRREIVLLVSPGLRDRRAGPVRCRGSDLGGGVSTHLEKAKAALADASGLDVDLAADRLPRTYLRLLNIARTQAQVAIAEALMAQLREAVVEGTGTVESLIEHERSNDWKAMEAEVDAAQRQEGTLA